MIKNDKPEKSVPATTPAGNEVPRRADSESSYSYSTQSSDASSHGARSPPGKSPANQNPKTLRASISTPAEKGSPKHSSHAASPNAAHENPSYVQEMNFTQYGSETGDPAEKHGRKHARHLQMLVDSANSHLNTDAQHISIYAFFCFSFVHMLFVILACVLSQMDEEGGGCLTYWGYKSRCDDVSYTTRTALMSSCPKRRSNLQAGAAFSIISVFVSAYLFILSWLLCIGLRRQVRLARRKVLYDVKHSADAFGSPDGEPVTADYQPGLLKWNALATMIFSLICELICWAIIAGLNGNHYCDDLKRLTYGVGFGLGLTAWVAEFIVCILFVVFV